MTPWVSRQSCTVRYPSPYTMSHILSPQPERSWEVDIEHMRSVIDDDTAAVIVNNPSNPCGSVFSEDHLRDILEVCEQNKIPIIADEIYAHFVFDGNFYHSLSSLSVNVPILSCGGLTKRWHICV